MSRDMYICIIKLTEEYIPWLEDGKDVCLGHPAPGREKFSLLLLQTSGSTNISMIRRRSSGQCKEKWCSPQVSVMIIVKVNIMANLKINYNKTLLQ